MKLFLLLFIFILNLTADINQNFHYSENIIYDIKPKKVINLHLNDEIKFKINQKTTTSYYYHKSFYFANYFYDENISKIYFDNILQEKFDINVELNKYDEKKGITDEEAILILENKKIQKYLKEKNNFILFVFLYISIFIFYLIIIFLSNNKKFYINEKLLYIIFILIFIYIIVAYNKKPFQFLSFKSFPLTKIDKINFIKNSLQNKNFKILKDIKYEYTFDFINKNSNLFRITIVTRNKNINNFICLQKNTITIKELYDFLFKLNNIQSLKYNTNINFVFKFKNPKGYSFYTKENINKVNFYFIDKYNKKYRYIYDINDNIFNIEEYNVFNFF